MKVVIMAGGKGTRIAALDSTVPKPMIRVLGKPILEYEIDCLCRSGLDDLLLVVGHLGSAITEYFGSGERFGVHIEYFTEIEPLGTAGALWYLRDCLTEDFLLINGDIIFDIDFDRLLHWHAAHQAEATLLTHPNSHPYDSALIECAADGRVTRWLHKEEPRTDCHNRVNAGIHVLSPAVLRMLSGPGKADLDRDILKPLVAHGSVYACDSPEYIFDVGTPERYARVTRDLERGIVAAKNLRQKQRAVFLDRDGTINREKGFITSPDAIELLPGAAAGIARLNALGVLVILATNQPVIARGECTEAQLDRIHARLETLLGQDGAYLDAIFYCPHHPDRGFPGEVPALKIDCSCRKPKPGLLLRAAGEYNIDLSRSCMAGDSARDLGAARAAGCTPYFIGAPSNLPVDFPDVRCFPTLDAFAAYYEETEGPCKC